MYTISRIILYVHNHIEPCKRIFTFSSTRLIDIPRLDKTEITEYFYLLDKTVNNVSVQTVSQFRLKLFEFS